MPGLSQLCIKEHSPLLYTRLLQWSIVWLLLINFTWCFQPDEDLFNPDYVEVDRVLDVAVTTDTETGEVGIKNPFETGSTKGLHCGGALMWRISSFVVGGDPLPCQVVQSIIRGGNVGAARGFRPREDQRVWGGPEATSRPQTCRE